MSRYYKKIKEFQDDLIFYWLLSSLCIRIFHFNWLHPISLVVGLIVYCSSFYLIYTHWKMTGSLKAALKDNLYSAWLILTLCFVTCLWLYSNCV